MTAARAGPGTLFFCVGGLTRDGHEFGRATRSARGVAALVVERELELNVPQVRVTDARAAMAPLAVRFQRDPTAELAVAGDHRDQRQDDHGLPRCARSSRPPVAQRAAGDRQAGRRRGGGGGRADHARRRSTCRRPSGGCSTAATGLRDGGLLARAGAAPRRRGIHFDVAVFTNLTQDHLDFHADMEDYFGRRSACSQPGVPAGRVVNVDDPYGRRLADEPRNRDVLGRGRRRRLSRRGRGARSMRSRRPLHRCARRRASSTSARDCRATSTSPTPSAPSPPPTCSESGPRPPPRRLAAPAGCPGRFEPVDEGQPFARAGRLRPHPRLARERAAARPARLTERPSSIGVSPAAAGTAIAPSGR